MNESVAVAKMDAVTDGEKGAGDEPEGASNSRGVERPAPSWETVRHNLAVAIMGFAMPGRPGGQSVASAERMLDALTDSDGPMPYLRRSFPDSDTASD